MDTGLLAAHQLWHPKLQIVLPTGSYEEQSRSRKCQTCRKIVTPIYVLHCRLLWSLVYQGGTQGSKGVCCPLHVHGIKSRTSWSLEHPGNCLVSQRLSSFHLQKGSCTSAAQWPRNEFHRSVQRVPRSLTVKTRSALSCWKRIVIGWHSKSIRHQLVMQEEYGNARLGPFSAYYQPSWRKVQVLWMGNPFTRWFARPKRLWTT